MFVKKDLCPGDDLSIKCHHINNDNYSVANHYNDNSFNNNDNIPIAFNFDNFDTNLHNCNNLNSISVSRVG
ncbi:MAG: hypothetical protein WAU62_04655 [Dehalococcoidales bacterium]